MIVRKGLPPTSYIPITVILETEDEANVLYHLLNTSIAEQERIFSNLRRPGALMNTAMRMFDSYWEVHKPGKET